MPKDKVLIELLSLHTGPEIRRRYRVSKQCLHQHCKRLGVFPKPVKNKEDQCRA